MEKYLKILKILLKLKRPCSKKVLLTQTCKQNSKPDYDQSCQAGIAGIGSTTKIENLTKVSHVRPVLYLAATLRPVCRGFSDRTVHRSQGGGGGGGKRIYWKRTK